MGCRRAGDEQGQIILLAGILLVLAFILFSTQLALLASLGQQAGRETENPLVDDYLLVRRTLEAQWKQELRNATGVAVCPDLVVYGQRLAAQLEAVEGLEKGRANGFSWSNMSILRTGASTGEINVTLAFYDDATSIADRLSYPFTCDSTLGAISGPASCAPSPAHCRVRFR